MTTTEDLQDVAEHLEHSKSPLMRRWAMRLPTKTTKHVRDAEPMALYSEPFRLLEAGAVEQEGNALRYRKSVLSAYIRRSEGNLFVDREYVPWDELDTQESGDWCFIGDLESVPGRDVKRMLDNLLRDEYYRFFQGFTNLLTALEESWLYRETETFHLGQRPGYHDVTSHVVLTYPNVKISFEFTNPCGDYWRTPMVYNYREELPDPYEKFDPSSVDLPYGTAILLRIAQLALKFRGKW